MLHSKCSCFRLIFCNQLIKYSVYSVTLWAMINTEERTLIVSPCLAVVELTQTYSYREVVGWAGEGGCRSAHNSFISRCLLVNALITVWLTKFYFNRTVWEQKNAWRNLTASQYFKPVVRIDLKPRKTFLTLK